MNLKDYLVIDERQRKRFADMYRRYKMLYSDPDVCSPMIIIKLPPQDDVTWEERLADPMVMLRSALDGLRPHLELEDDAVPTVRVDFGTAQVPAAFGCELYVPPNNLPAAATHVVQSADDVFELEEPPLDAGWYGKLYRFTEVFQQNLPEGVHIQHPDIQSPFNNAHLIRGNDILLDFYERPEAVSRLLEVVTNFMIRLVPRLKSMISDDPDWFFDWSALWKGAARLSNCSMHMISPEQYREFVMPHDIRLLESVGGGRMHYCGTQDAVIDDFFKVPLITGLDYDAQYHDLWSVSERAPRGIPICHWGDLDDPSIQRLLDGDWPDKRNVIIQVSVESMEQGRDALKTLRRTAQAVTP